jgi:hypothetical protein
VSRHYLPVSFVAAGFICLVLACIELRGTVGDPTGLQTWAERIAVPLLLASFFVGDLLFWATKWTEPRPDEVHVSPITGREMLEQEDVREHSTLREREDASELRKTSLQGNTQIAENLG